MAKAPAFQFYVRDWLCSRKVSTMSGDCIKAYMYLLCEAWLNEPRATLPNDDEELASMARLELNVWMSIKHTVLGCFKTGECDEHRGLLYSERLLEISRNYESKKRLGNKNAKATRNKRGTNAKKRFASSSATSTVTDLNNGASRPATPILEKFKINTDDL